MALYLVTSWGDEAERSRRNHPAAAKYSEDQARDERGRFEGGPKWEDAKAAVKEANVGQPYGTKDPAVHAATTTTDHPDVMYRTSRSDQRDSIRSSGLEAGRSLGGAHDRVYLWQHDPEVKPRMDTAPQDTYRVNVSGLPLRPDPEAPDHWAISEQDIAPERLSLVATTHPDGMPKSRARVFVVKDWETEPRDYAGRWTSGGDEGPTTTATSDVPRDASLPADHSSDMVALAVNGGATMRADPDQVVQLTSDWGKGDKPVQLMGLGVNGKDNGNLFNKSALGLSRADMPQLPTDAAGIKDFADFLGQRGISLSHEQVDPRTLMATQGELDGRKVGQMLEGFLSGRYDPADQSVFAAKGGEVLDGHHRWAAACITALTRPGTTIGVLRADTDIKTLVAVSHEYATSRGIAAKPFGKRKSKALAPDPSKAWLRIGGKWVLVATDTADGVPPEGYGLPLCKAEPNAKRLAKRLGSATLHLLKYSEDEPRDPAGRWTSGDGGGRASMEEAGRHMADAASAFHEAGGTVERFDGSDAPKVREAERELGQLRGGLIEANGGQPLPGRVESGLRMATMALSAQRVNASASIEIARSAEGHIAAVIATNPRQVMGTDVTHISFLGSTGITHGAGSALIQGVMERAAGEGRGVDLEPLDDKAQAYWVNTVGAGPAALGQLGWSAAETAQLARAA